MLKTTKPQRGPVPLNESPIGTTTFSEEQLLQDAARIDGAAAEQEASNPLDELIAGREPTVEKRVPAADPAVQQALLLLVATGTKLLEVKQHWSDPGDEWRGEVARLGAVLVDRYLPNFLQEQGELVALLVLIGSYVGTNLVKNGSVGSGGDPGSTGVGKEHFVESDPPGPRTSAFGHP